MLLARTRKVHTHNARALYKISVLIYQFLHKKEIELTSRKSTLNKTLLYCLSVFTVINDQFARKPGSLTSHWNRTTPSGHLQFLL